MSDQTIIVPPKDFDPRLYEILRHLSIKANDTALSLDAVGRGESPDGSGTPLIDLSRFFYLPGRPANQVGFGGSIASGILTLSSTSAVTKGFIYLGDPDIRVTLDEAQGFLGIGTLTPTAPLHIVGPSGGGSGLLTNSVVADNWAGPYSGSGTPLAVPSYTALSSDDGTGSYMAINTAAPTGANRQKNGLSGVVTEGLIYTITCSVFALGGTFTVGSIITFHLVTSLGNRFASAIYDLTGIGTTPTTITTTVDTSTGSVGSGTANSIELDATGNALYVCVSYVTAASGGDITRWDDSGGTQVAFVDSTGMFTMPAITIVVGGADGKWLRSGIGGLAAWASPAALTKTDDTNVTLTLGGSPTTALLNAASLTLGWTGQLAISRGGTGQATATAAFAALSPLTTVGDLLYHNGSNNVRRAIGSSGDVLTVSGGLPVWAAPVVTVVDAPRTWNTLQTFQDTTIEIIDNATPTKIAQFQCSGLTAGTHIYSFPPSAAASTVTLAALELEQIFTQNQHFTQGQFGVDVDSASGKLTVTAFGDSGTLILFNSQSGRGVNLLAVPTLAASRIAWMPDSNGNVVLWNTAGDGLPLAGSIIYGAGINTGMTELAIGASGTILTSTGSAPQWSTNAAVVDVARTWATLQTFKDTTFKIVDDGDASKTLVFSLGGATVNADLTIISSQTADHSITLPDATTTLAGLAVVETFTAAQIIAPSSGTALTLTPPSGTFLTLNTAFTDTSFPAAGTGALTAGIYTLEPTISNAGSGLGPNLSVFAINPTATTLVDCTFVGINMSITGSLGASDAGLTVINGLRFVATTAGTSGGNFNSLTGTSGVVVHGSADTLTTMQGVGANLTVNASVGTVNTSRGFNVVCSIGASSTITTFNGLRVANPTGSGTITTAIGLRIENITKGGTNYAIDSAGGQSRHVGNFFIGAATNPTARLHLAAGTTAASTAPLKFITGTSMTAAEVGAVEFTTDDLFFTITTGAARKRFLLADPVGGLTSGRVPFATTNGRLTDDASFLFSTGSGLTAPISMPYVAKTAIYTITTADGIINCTANTFTVTLPTAVSVPGRLYHIKNSGAGTITLATTSSQTIDGAATQTIAAAASIEVASNGANWIII